MKKIALLLALFTVGQYVKAQEDNSRVITTGVPFLLIAADARSAGMADMGVATSADAFSQQYNPAKYAFSLQKQGFSISYTPYLSSIANDISLGQLTYYNRINERSAFAGSLRYFGLGDIELRRDQDDPGVTVNPNELALDGDLIELTVSEPVPITAKLAATPAPVPPDEPPGTCSVFLGFLVAPNALVSVVEPIANSSILVLPIITAPAS